MPAAGIPVDHPRVSTHSRPWHRPRRVAPEGPGDVPSGPPEPPQLPRLAPGPGYPGDRSKWGRNSKGGKDHGPWAPVIFPLVDLPAFLLIFFKSLYARLVLIYFGFPPCWLCPDAICLVRSEPPAPKAVAGIPSAGKPSVPLRPRTGTVSECFHMFD